MKADPEQKGPGAIKVQRSPAQQDQEDIAAAIDQFRKVAQWTIVAFGAVASLMLAGVQLTSLGETSGWRLALALVSLAIALTGTLIAIFKLTDFLIPRVVAYEILKDASDPGSPLGRFAKEHLIELLPWDADKKGMLTGSQLLEKYEKASHQAATAKLSEPTPEFDLRNEQVHTVLWWARWVQAEAEFRKTRRWVAAAAVMVAAGIIIFVIAADPDTKTARSLPPSTQAGEVTVVLD